jgi:HK97 family phage prohead protease
MTTPAPGVLEELRGGGVLKRYHPIGSLEGDDLEGVVDGMAVPYETRTELSPRVWETFSRGAFSRAVKDPARVKVRGVGHSREVIGHVLALEDRAAGLWVRMRIVDTTAGLDALKLLRAGSIDEFSVEFETNPRWHTVTETRDGILVRHNRAHLVGISPVPHGAYGRDARVLSVRDADDKEREARIAQERAFWERLRA